MEELRKFQSSTFDTIARRKLVEDQNTKLELSGRNTGIAKWNKLHEWFKGVSGCWINSQWKFPRYQSTSVIPTSSKSWRNAKPFFWSAEPQRRAAKHLVHTWFFAKGFLQIQMRHYQHFILKNWINGVHRTEEPLHSSTVEKSERQTRDQDLKCQSGPSAKNSVIFSGGDSSKNYDYVNHLPRKSFSTSYFKN